MNTVIQDEPDGLPATTEAAKGIKAIDKTTVHRICSGQVVLTLATAVKELVENSIDAGATSVEVRLKDHGIALLEVCDNGKGVEESDFEGLTLKHHTSKIRDFGDLVGVKTFGFRGEALSSLCALSDLSIITRHTSHTVGTKLVYDHNGKLNSKTPISRQVGTTVSLQNLFSTLPVRHKEFQRNIKKEFNKMVQILYSYCLISTGVRIICTNQTDKGKKTVVVSTDSHNSVKENISSVFGAKQVSSLIEFRQEAASSDVLTEYGMPTLEISQDNCLFNIEGYISSCAHGQGRSATDRQFYFINSRPCDPAKVMKLVNEVYHQYNRHQSPFVVLNIRLKEDDVDINVTPDKRQILVNNEKIMLATIKTSMVRLYENIPSTYNLHNTSLNSSMNMSFESSPGIRSPSITSPSVKSGNGRISALTMKFGRKAGGSPLTESSGSPFNTSPSSAGLKRSFSQGSDNSSPLSNKQPKLELFFKSKSYPLESSQESSDLLNSSSTLESVMEGIEELDKDGNDSFSSSPKNGECPMISTQEKDTTVSATSEQEYNEVTANSPGDVMPQVKLTEDKLENLAGSSDVDAVSKGSNELSLPNGNSSFSCNNSIVDETTDEDLKENDNFCESSISSVMQGNVKSVLSKFSCSGESTDDTRTNEFRKDGDVLAKSSHSAAKPSSNCKNVHNATNQFLSNLMAKKSGRDKNTRNFSASNQIDNEKEVVILNGDRVGVNIVDNEDFESGSDNATSSDNNKKKILMCEEYNPDDFKIKRKSRQVGFCLESLKKKILSSTKKKEEADVMRRFHAKISPSDNQSAEDELRKEISKDMFAKMDILGQFNLGFIIARLGSDLFIIDQHATDEKFNFETLQQTCVLQNQRLIIPQLLELTAVNESILMDNMEIFKKNGFEFKVDEDQPVGRRVSLVSMPFSRGWDFGREDIEELIFMLSDSPGVMCRPSRVRAMFASRACRKSVMIGTALTTGQMQKLVLHMGEIEQPWNCPHGRPTMRHLVNLDMIASSEAE